MVGIQIPTVYDTVRYALSSPRQVNIKIVKFLFGESVSSVEKCQSKITIFGQDGSHLSSIEKRKEEMFVPALIKNIRQGSQCWSPDKSEQIMIEHVSVLSCHHHAGTTARVASLLKFRNKISFFKWILY